MAMLHKVAGELDSAPETGLSIGSGEFSASCYKDPTFH
jgi:hypothetical protein